MKQHVQGHAKTTWKHLAVLIIPAAAILFLPSFLCGNNSYLWTKTYDANQTIAARFAPPKDCRRVTVKKGSFAHWLRHLPLKKGKPEVLLYNGKTKGNQLAHEAVVDMDTGKRDLQQCADAVMRLKGEYHFSRNEFPDIHFNFTSGDKAAFSKWCAGFRPNIAGNRVTWKQSASKDNSYSTFRKYMDTVFAYAGSYSLNREMKKIQPAEMNIGDVFIQGGFPGHAVIVVDIAKNNKTGETFFMLAQSYMPAQQVHVLKNPTGGGISPWYRLAPGQPLLTPEWGFKMSGLKRFRD